MTLDFAEMLAIGAAIFAVLMVGTGNLRFNLFLYSCQTTLVAAVTAAQAGIFNENHLYTLALSIFLLKAIGVAVFLVWILQFICVFVDDGTMLPIPLAMHISIVLMGVAHLLACQLPAAPGGESITGSATAAISLLFTGALFMLTRKTAISQVIGFLTIENGIYLVALTLAHGMPMMVELGILLDVLVGVMIAGLITFRIQKSFEHIDVSRLTELKD
jgi:hydrogenase-4 component E